MPRYASTNNNTETVEEQVVGELKEKPLYPSKTSLFGLKVPWVYIQSDMDSSAQHTSAAQRPLLGSLLFLALLVKWMVQTVTLH